MKQKKCDMQLLARKNDCPLCEKNQKRRFWAGNTLSAYEKCMMFGIVFFVILGFISLICGRVFSGMISIFQITVMVVSLLIKKCIIKTPKIWISYVAVILSCVLIIPYFLFFNIGTLDSVMYKWDEVVLSDIVPEPNSSYGIILYNTDSSLSLEVREVSPKEFLKYVEDCKNKGFTIDLEKTESHYRAFNKNGYELSVDYDEIENIMNISVEAKRDLGTLIWPNSELAKIIPIPKSEVGEIISDSEDSFSVYVGETSIKEFNAYITECEKMGFSIDAEKGERDFYAKNEGLYSLIVKYEGNNIIYICVDEPDFSVEYEVECVENIIFSKYDVDIYVDDLEEQTIGHGKKETFFTVLSRGAHTFKFVSSEDEKLSGEVKLDILKNEKLKLKIFCSSSGIRVETIIGPSSAEDKHNPTEYSIDYTDAQAFEDALNSGIKVNGKIVQFNVVEYEPNSAMGINCWSGEHLNFISENKLNVFSGDIIIGRIKSEPIKVLGSWKVQYEVLSINGKKVENNSEPKNDKAKKSKIKESKKNENTNSVFYSTNDYETAKKGDTGVFSYMERGDSYDIYWIIDFDEGYVYWFTDGNDDPTCDKVRIVSGNLNENLIITYHDGGNTWSYGLHFKYVNHPETLIMNDNNGFEHKYSTTDLDEALKLKNSKEIIER